MKFRLAACVLGLTACVDPAPDELVPDEPSTTAAAAVTPGQRPKPLLPPDILWTNGASIVSHGYVQPTRASFDGRIAFESFDAAKYKSRCFRMIRPEQLTGHLGSTVQEVAEPLGARFCLPAATFHASTKPGLLGIQGAICDATPAMPMGRVQPLQTNAQPTACTDPLYPNHDCYKLHAITHFEPNDGSAPEFWSKPLEVVIQNPKTATATIVAVKDLGPAKGVAINLPGQILEPTVSGDGRLIVYHDGKTIKYTVNRTGTPCDASAFTPAARKVSEMYDDLGAAGTADDLRNLYGLARFPLRSSEGTTVTSGADVGGAYPWIDRNASNLFIEAGGRPLYYQDPTDGLVKSRWPVIGSPPPPTYANITALGDIGGRSGITVMGLWTQGKMVVLDSRINNADIPVFESNSVMLDLYTGTPLGTEVRGSNSFFINALEHVLNHDPEVRPVTPRDVVWQVAATTGTDEIAFDDFQLRRALIVSPMNATIENQNPSLHLRGYQDGFVPAPGTFMGTGWGGTPRVQNAAAGLHWTLPTFGALNGGARIEPIAAGGVKAKGIHLDGTDDRIDYTIAAQGTKATDMTNSAWTYAVWFNPSTALDATHRRLFTAPDGSMVDLTAARILFKKPGVAGSEIVVPIPLRIATSRWSHLAIVSTLGGGTTTLTAYLDGYPLGSVTTAASMLRMGPGTFSVGSNGVAGVIGWIDEVKVLGEHPGLEEVCNHAHGTLVGVSATSGPGYDRAIQYPSHTAVNSAVAATTGPTFPRYVCESHAILPADAAGYVCKFSRTDGRCVGARVQFPTGPLKHGVPRPGATANAFCKSCHDDSHLTSTMQATAALSFTGGLLLENDRRRQPMQLPMRLFGHIPGNHFGPGLPAGTTVVPAGLKSDTYVLPLGP